MSTAVYAVHAAQWAQRSSAGALPPRREFFSQLRRDETSLQDGPLLHQTFQVPKMEVRYTYLSCMDTAYGYGKTHPQNSRL